MRKTSLLGTFGALALLAGAAPWAHACSCANSDFYQAYAGSYAVFQGEVLDISSPDTGYPALVTATIRVEREWKGELETSTVQVKTSASDASCGFRFSIGSRYLVYAYRWLSTSGNYLATSLCDRTHATWPEDPDLNLLKSVQHVNLAVSPNPSARQFQLRWSTLGNPGSQGHARLEVLDSQGRRIQTLFNATAGPGPHEISWDGRDENGESVPKGIYWARLSYDGYVVGRRLVKLTGP